MYTKSYKAEVVDEIIFALAAEAKERGRHLIKTATIIERLGARIDLTDILPEREELIAAGVKQLVQSRLYCLGYYSLGLGPTAGYFVNIEECENLAYLKLIIQNKDDVLGAKVAARNRIKELKKLNGQMVLVLDENNDLVLQETMPFEELMEDLEADAV